MNNNEIIQKFFNDYSKRFTKDTLKQIENSLKSLFMMYPKKIEEFTYRDLKNWQNNMSIRGLKENTINTRVLLVKIFFKYCYEEEIIQNNPTSKLNAVQLSKPLPKFLKLEQLIKLMEVAKDDVLYRTIIELLFATGMRKSELLNIKLTDIDWERKIIFIYVSKNNMQTFVPFSTRVEVWLEKYLQVRNSDSKYLFVDKNGKLLTKDILYHSLKKYGKKAGIPFNIGPHYLRRTCATYCFAKGASMQFVMRLLNIRDRNTLKFYVNLSAVAKKEFSCDSLPL